MSLFSSSGVNNVHGQSTVTDFGGLYTTTDGEILEHLQWYQNNPRYLYKIGLPAVTSLIFCPMIMIAYTPISNFLWPNRTQPTINGAIACFLAPAGMVYAVSFGFAFQQVLQKQIDITTRLNNDFSEMELLINLTKKLACLKSTTRMKMYLALKEEIMTVIRYITQMPVSEKNREGTSVLYLLKNNVLVLLPSASIDPSICFKLEDDHIHRSNFKSVIQYNTS